MFLKTPVDATPMFAAMLLSVLLSYAAAAQRRHVDSTIVTAKRSDDAMKRRGEMQTRPRRYAIATAAGAGSDAA